MQYPPPNSELPGCLMPGYGPLGADLDPEQEATQPVLSYPAELTLLHSSWRSCELAKFSGIFDPPKLLEKVTAMAPEPSAIIPAAPGSPIAPAHAPATPTPNANIPQSHQKEPLRASPSVANAIEPSSNTEPDPKSGSGNQPEPVSRDQGMPKPAASGLVPSSDEASKKNAIEDTIPSTGVPSHAGLNNNDADPGQNQKLGGFISSALGQVSDSAGRSTPIKVDTLGETAANIMSPLSIVVDGVTTAIAPHSLGETSKTQSIDSGGNELAVSQVASQVIIGSQILVAGGFAIIVSGLPISLPVPTVHDLDTDVHSSAIETATHTVDDQTFATNPTAIVTDESATRIEGHAATIARTPVNLQSSGALVIGDSTLPVRPDAVSEAAATQSASVYYIGDQTFTANPSGIPIAGTTISAGGPGLDFSGTTVSVQPSGDIGATTFTILPAPPVSEQPSVYSIGDQKLTAASSALVIAGSTITPGESAVTIAGTPVSLAPSGSLVIGASTIAPISVVAASTSQASTGDHTSAATSAAVSEILVLSTGSELTIGGTVISIQGSSTSKSGDQASDSQSAGVTHTASEGYDEDRKPSQYWTLISALVTVLFSTCIYNL